MKKIFTLFFAGSLVIALLNIGFSSRNAELHTFTVAASESSDTLAANGLLALREQSSAEQPVVHGLGEAPYGKAVEVREGDSTFYKDLSVTLGSVTGSETCIRADCLTVELQTSVSGEEIQSSSHTLGDVFSYKGYLIKISQIAPIEVTSGVSRRVVLLFSHSRDTTE